MKILTQRKKKVFSPDYGWLEQVKYYVFGFCVMTENNPIEAFTEERTVHDLEDMAMYQEWREKMKLMRLEDDDFVQILNTRF